MENEKPTLPYTLRVINTVGAGLRAMGLPIAEFKEETLLRAASKQTGLSDFGDPYFLEGLRCLLDSGEHDAHLNFLGRIGSYNWVLLQLTNRLRLVDTMKRRPEIFQRPLLPPIIITGLARSGTTLLHRMLALDPSRRGIPYWELIRPMPPVEGSPDYRQQTAEEEFKMRLKLAANMDHKHYSRPEEPDECQVMLGLTFVNTAFWVFTQVFGYVRWYMEQNLFEKKYEDYHRLLQVLQSAHPAKRLVLKAPEHLPNIDVLLENIPQAMVIQTHRDPLQVLPSLNSLLYSTQISSTDQVDIKRMAETNLNLLEWSIARNLAARRKCAGKIFDLPYEQILADPVGAVRNVYKHFQLDWPDGFEHHLQEYVDQNPKDKYGRHHYQLEDFGQISEEISKRFKEYREEFGYS